MDETRGIWRRYFLTLIPLGFTILAGSAWGQDDTVASSFEDRLLNLWDNYIQAKTGDDVEAKKRAFEAIRGLQQTTTAEIFETGSYLFLEEGLNQLRLKRYDEARQDFIYAIELNPYSWPAYKGLAQIKKERDGDFRHFLVLNLKGMRSAFQMQNAFFVLDSWIWLIKNIIWILMVGFSAFVFILCAKYLRPFFFTLVHAIEEKVNRLYAQLIALFLLLLPFILGANFFLVAALYIVLFIPFFESRERMTAFLIFLIPLSLPFLGLFMSNINHARSDPLLRAHMHQYFDGDIDQRIEFLKKHSGSGDLQYLSLLHIGNLQKAKGELQEALLVFSQIPSYSKLWPLAQVNKGNVEFLTRHFQDAIASYEGARQEDPDLALAQYNLSVVKARQGLHQEAESLRSQALQKDPSLKNRVPGVVIDAEPEPMTRIYQELAGYSNPKTIGWFAHPSIFVPLVATIAILGITFIHLRSRNPRLLAKSCEKCGRIFFQSDSPESEWCSQCVNLYIRKDDLPSEAKLKKHEEVKRFNKNIRRSTLIGQILLPGTKKILLGNALSGLITLLVWVALVVFCVSPITLISYPFMAYIQGPVILTWITFAVTLVYWAIFGLRPIWQEE